MHAGSLVTLSAGNGLVSLSKQDSVNRVTGRAPGTGTITARNSHGLLIGRVDIIVSSAETSVRRLVSTAYNGLTARTQLTDSNPPGEGVLTVTLPTGEFRI